VKVDPVNTMMKAPEIKRLKPQSDKLLSSLLQFCYQIQLAPLQRDADESDVPQRAIRQRLGAAG
jgi:hypothetical protein